MQIRQQTRNTLVQRRKLLVILAITAAAMAIVLAAALHVLFAAAAGVSLVRTLSYAVVVWLALVICGTAVVLAFHRRPASRAVAAAIALGAVVLCGAVPASTWWTYAVDHNPRVDGAACPACAVIAYLDAFNQWGDTHTFERVLCDNRRDALKAQAIRFTAAYQQQARLWGVIPNLEPGRIDGDEDTTKTELTLSVPVSHAHEKPGGIIVSRIEVIWVFTVVKKRTAWTVCAVTMPEVCQVITCGGPAPGHPSPIASMPSPSPSPSWRAWDQRVSWWCSDDAGTLKRPDCPKPPPDWVQPGPWECSPDYPFRTPEEAASCRSQGWNVS